MTYFREEIILQLLNWLKTSNMKFKNIFEQQNSWEFLQHFNEINENFE